MPINSFPQSRAGKTDAEAVSFAASWLKGFEWRGVMVTACLSVWAMAGAQAQSDKPSAPFGPSTASATHFAAPTRMLDDTPTETLRQSTASAAVGGGLRDNAAAPRSNAKTLDAAFKRADRDSDDRLSREEAEHFPALAQQFEQFDGNRDNFISRDEFNRAANQ